MLPVILRSSYFFAFLFYNPSGWPDGVLRPYAEQFRHNGKINVAFLFERKGMILVDGQGKDEDTMLGIVLDAGAEDLKASGDQFEITTDPASFAQVRTALEKAGVKIESAEVAQVPKAAVDVDEETGKKISRLMENLDDHDDVQNVYTTANLTAAMMEA